VKFLVFLMLAATGSLLAVGCASNDDGGGARGGAATSRSPEPCPAIDTAEACAVFVLANQERQDRGLPPYGYDTALARAALGHAQDMMEQDYFDHTSLDGRTFGDRADDAGYSGFPSGENIALGQRTPAEVMESWMDSQGHRQNILSSRSSEIGVGVVARYWVQVFGRE
jgi:uncharacterized protein YkwD